MILPTKYEKISSNSLVLGAEIIRNLLAEEFLDPNDLYIKLNDSISSVKYLDTLTLLFALGIIELIDNNIRLKR